jgi:hypothetical protein
MKTMPLFCALQCALSHNIAQFFRGISSAQRLMGPFICRVVMVGVYLCSYDYADAQDSLQSMKPDTFLHENARPVFTIGQSTIVPSTSVCEFRLTDFPAVHVRKLSLAIRFDQPLPADFEVAIAVVNWQPFPERYNMTKRIVDGILWVEVACPADLDLVPGPFLQLRWETASSPLQVTKVIALDGIVVTDNIDGFRQSWTAPAKWVEKSGQ